jgi:hypothetical protein
MFWWLRKVLFGPLVEPEHTPDTSGGLTVDITARETSILAILAVACLFLGVYPKPLLTSMQPSLEAGVLQVVHNQQTDFAQNGPAASFERISKPLLVGATGGLDATAKPSSGEAGPGRAGVLKPPVMMDGLADNLPPAYRVDAQQAAAVVKDR